MMKDVLEVKGIMIVSLEIPGITVLSDQLMADMEGAIDRVEDLGQPSVLFLEIGGQLNTDSATAWPGATEVRSVSKWERVLRRIERSSFTTVVLVKNACSLLALELLLVADRRIANANFSFRPASSDGEIWPGMALYRLSRQVGFSCAQKLFLDGVEITSSSALGMQIVDEILDEQASGHDALKYFLGNAPLRDYAVCRRLMQDSSSISFDDALGGHLAACDRSLRKSRG